MPTKTVGTYAPPAGSNLPKSARENRPLTWPAPAGENAARGPPSPQGREPAFRSTSRARRPLVRDLRSQIQDFASRWLAWRIVYPTTSSPS